MENVFDCGAPGHAGGTSSSIINGPAKQNIMRCSGNLSSTRMAKRGMDHTGQLVLIWGSHAQRKMTIARAAPQPANGSSLGTPTRATCTVKGINATCYAQALTRTWLRKTCTPAVTNNDNEITHVRRAGSSEVVCCRRRFDNVAAEDPH